MTDPAEQSWVADPSVAWNIVLTAQLAALPSTDDLRRALTQLARSQGWRRPSEDAVLVGPVAELQWRLAADVPGACPVRLGVDGRTLVVSAHHSHVDGVGLLAVLHELTATDILSGARGVGHRPATTGWSSLVSRLVEVGFAPPARVRPSVAAPTGHDVFARRSVAGAPRTAHLVHAGAAALADWNTVHGGASKRVAVAVGVSRTGGTDLTVRENSGWLRLRGVERLSAADVARAISSAPLVSTPTGVRRSRPVRDRLVSWGLQVMAPRLGSTLLVSHLGRVVAPEVDDVAFFPVTGGGSGLSLGAVTLGNRTTLTLRARGRQHSIEGLQVILEALDEKLKLSRDSAPGGAEV